MACNTGLIALLLSCFEGCGTSSPPSGSVSGNVTSGHKTLGFGYVQLVRSDGVPIGTAPIDPKGGFQFESAIPVGEYRVAILPPKEEVPAGAPDPKLEQAVKSIPAKYRSDTTSGFTAVVKEGDNTFAFDMP